MNNKGQMVEIESTIKSFSDFISAGYDGFFNAAKVYVKAVDSNPDMYDIFAERLGNSISKTMFRRLEDVGRKKYHHMLLLGGGGTPSRNRVIGSLAYNEQERILGGEKFDLLTTSGDAGDKLKIDLLTCEDEQFDQVVATGIIRSLSEQRAYIESIERRRATRLTIIERPIEKDYSVFRNKVTFRRGVTLTREQIKEILVSM